MKRLIAVLLALIMTFSLAACSAKEEATAEEAKAETHAEGNADASVNETSTEEPIELHFAWCVDNVDTSQQQYYEYAEAYVEYLNTTRDDIHITLDLMNGESSVDKQIGDVETAIAMGVDAIILSCVDAVGLTPIAKDAMAAGVPVLDWRDMGDVCTVTIDVDLDISYGAFAVEWYKKYMDDNPDVVLNVGFIKGAPQHPNCFPRFEMLASLQEEYPDQFNLVVEQFGDWSTETAMKMMEDWLQTYPELNCIVGANEETARGCVEVLKSVGRLDEFVITTFNGTTGLDMLHNNEIAMDVGCNKSVGIPMLIDYTINMVLDGLTGHYDFSEQTMRCVTAENVVEYEQWLNSSSDFTKYEYSTLKDSYR